ncbi:MAG: metalloprotease TldD, partial [Phyllobacterium sp.]|nr:metalloprotease TldD [Phyllobacterium sp.]
MKSLIDSFDAPREKILETVKQSLEGADDGELFIEYRESEGLAFDNGRLKNGTFNQDQGFGLRAVAGEAVGYAHAGELSLGALKRAADAASAVRTGYTGAYTAAPPGTNRSLYGDENPIGSPSFEAKVKLLQEIDAYLRAKDPKVRQVSVSLAGSWQQVEILRADGHFVRDIRPMVRLNVSVVVGDGDRQESGSYGAGGRKGFGEFITAEKWQHAADEALRQALVNLEAIPAPAGTFDIVLSNGWPGVMLHEAVGHGLEGDFNRKKTSAFAGLLGQKVASKGVTVVDDGTISERRGSLTVDDEGMPTNKTVLIDDGILVGYMQDRQNARLMGMQPTGNGRRESYAHAPMPRMTNTYMLDGDKTPEEIIASVKNGIYAVSFGGGQVDITSGKFVFGCTEAYMIENGRIAAPVKGAMLIGNGPDAMQRISMIGNDLQLDTGMGNCGKGGQWV